MKRILIIHAVRMVRKTTRTKCQEISDIFYRRGSSSPRPFQGFLFEFLHGIQGQLDFDRQNMK